MEKQKKYLHYLERTSGMTLIELLVATTLVGIVMVGAVSVDFAIHSMRKTTADSSTVALQTSATMLDITNNLAQAVGDASDVGIRIDPATPATLKTWFCARQAVDNDPTDGDLDNDLSLYTDDTWVCYWKPNLNTDANIYKCDRTAVQGPGTCQAVGGTTTIGTAACAAGCASFVFTYTLTNNPATRQFSIDVDLTNRAYPLQQVNPAQPMKNPEYRLSSHVSPKGHSY
jgi:prepilin-type N-terminal cleavage/methylation domain-containing protein